MYKLEGKIVNSFFKLKIITLKIITLKYVNILNIKINNNNQNFDITN